MASTLSEGSKGTRSLEFPEAPESMDRLVSVIYWIARGYSYAEVSEKVGVNPARVQGLASFFGFKGRALPNGARRLEILIPARAVALIQRASGIRNMDEVEFVERIVSIVCTDPDLLENILDDRKPVR